MSQSSVILGLSDGTTTPYDSGPSLLFDSWFVWSQPTGTYIGLTPVIENSGFKMKLSPSATLPKHTFFAGFQTFQDKTGTVAYIYDTLVQRPTQLLPSTTTTFAIDGTLSNDFYGKLGGNATVTALTVADGQVLTVGLLNSGTSYTVTWPGTVKWPATPTHTQPASQLGLYTFRGVGGVTYGEMTSYLTTDTTATTGGQGYDPTLVPKNYGNSGNDPFHGSGSKQVP